ncbi:cation:dicarboxylase symporter family transporter, partial [Fulvivirga sp. RKSG066]|uniref:dicarboxylate/amino acid:cation symporter n=1 Tax=Fulvivirga aurantia TaxID=2529383 RepID=UPI0012BC8648
MKKLPLHVKIILGLVAGILWAFVSSYFDWNEFTINWIDPFGTIFIRLLKYIAVPLVLFSIISGVSSLTDLSKLGRLSAKTLGMYLTTTVIAVGIGLLLVNTVKPGAFLDYDQRVKNRIAYEKWVEDTPGVPQPKDGRSFINDPQYQSVVEEAMTAKEMAEIQAKQAGVEDKMATAQETKESSPLTFIVDMVPENIVLAISDNGLMLQVIFFAIFFGITLALIPSDQAKPVVDFINSINAAFLKMVDIVMKAAPFFVFALLAGVIAKMADTPAEVLEIFKGLGSYS